MKITLSWLLALTIFLSISCEKSDTDSDAPTSGKKSAASSAASYPLDMSLTSKDGRSIDVSVTGRSESQVFFLNRANKKDYALEFDQLSPKDKLRLKKMPVHMPPDPEKQAAGRKRSEKLQRYIEFREKEIERLTRNLKEKELEQTQYASGPSSKLRQIDRDIRALAAEIENLDIEKKAAEGGADF